MSVGEKIRYIRNLRNLTQKELGMMVGFSESTADVRIRQYESGKMVPKADKLKKIADALQVDISALSGIDFQSEDELMQTLFDLERSCGLHLEKQGPRYVLYFDEDNPEGESLKYALDAWYTAREKYLPKPGMSEEESEKSCLDYQIWTQRYPIDLLNERQEKQQRAAHEYQGRVVKLQAEGFGIERAYELALIFEKMYQNGIWIDLEVDNKRSDLRKQVVRASFKYSQIIDLDEKPAEAFTEFLCAAECLNKAGIEAEQSAHTYEDETYLDYYIYNTPITVLVMENVKKMGQEILNGTFEEEYKQYEFKDALRIYNVKLEDIA